MAIYLNDGVTVDASWVNHIAVSADGVNWSTINKNSINVNPRFINQPTAGTIPFVNKGSHAEISLTSGSDDTQILVFDPNDVVNQPTWQGNTSTALQNAVADLTGWLN